MQQSSGPPQLILRFLRWYCPPHLCEGIEGDLLEQYEADCVATGERTARWRFAWRVIQFFRPAIILRNKFSCNLNHGPMIRNYIKVMLRSLWKQKTNSAIHVLGLTLGLAFAFITGVFVSQELRVNRSLRDADRLYMVEGAMKDGTFWYPFMSPAPAATVACAEYPTLFEGRFRYQDRMITVSKGDQHFRVQSLLCDSSLISLFGFPVLHGDATHIFSNAHSIVITKTIALRYFNRTDVVGELLTLSAQSRDAKRYDYTISAVLDDLPRNSVTNLVDMDTQIFLSMQEIDVFRDVDPDQWKAGNSVNFIKLKPGASPEDAEKALAAIMKARAPEQLQKLDLSLHPLLSYYLEANQGRVKKLIYTLSAITLFILILAVINFVNITVGSSLTRLREIGVRKVIGGRRRQLVGQFLGESVLLSVGAFVMAVVIYALTRSYFGSLLGTTLVPVTELGPAFTGTMFAISIMIGLLAGIYPAFLLSSYNAVESLKNKLPLLAGGGNLSRSLVTLQFALAIGVFIFAMVIDRQVSYFLQKDLGYDKDYVLTVSSVPRRWSREGERSIEAARQQFLSVPQVRNISLSWEIPTGNYGNQVDLYAEGTDRNKALGMPLLMTDEHFAETYGITMRSGVFLGDDQHLWQPGDIVLNESAARALDVSQADHVLIGGDTTVFTVKGVVSDFHFFSFHEAVKPMAFVNTRATTAFRYFSIRLQSGDMADALRAIEAKWREVFPDEPFVYAFMDQELARLYKNEIRLKKASSIATGLMLLIVFTGVFGMVSLVISKRTKEMGIRKVLGASVRDIILLVSRPYFVLIIVSFAITAPMAYYASIRWLSSFAYKVALPWWIFVVPVVITLILTGILVGAKSMRAAMRNPVRALRYE